MRIMRSHYIGIQHVITERHKYENNRKQFNIYNQIDQTLAPNIVDNMNLIAFLKKSKLYNLI